MLSDIKTAWMTALGNNTYAPAELKSHTAKPDGTSLGYDPLGVLTEMFRIRVDMAQMPEY